MARIQGFEVDLFADIQDGGSVQGFSPIEIGRMNAELEERLDELLADVFDDREASEIVDRVKSEILDAS